MSIKNVFRFNFLLALVLVLSVGFYMASSTMAEEDAKKDAQPVGTVAIDEKQINLGIGASWGHGVLSFQGADYKFKVKGFKALAVGVVKVSAVGDVYNMTDLSQFSGTYNAASASIALAAGVGGQTLGNQNGVHINLRSTQKGVNLNLGLDGITIELQEKIEEKAE